MIGLQLGGADIPADMDGSSIVSMVPQLRSELAYLQAGTGGQHCGCGLSGRPEFRATGPARMVVLCSGCQRSGSGWQDRRQVPGPGLIGGQAQQGTGLTGP